MKGWEKWAEDVWQLGSDRDSKAIGFGHQGKTSSICAGSLVQRINKVPLVFKADCLSKISLWCCLLLLFWLGEKGRMGAGKARPGVNCYLRFWRICKELLSPPWFGLQVQRGTCGSQLSCSACSWGTWAALTHCTGHTKVMKDAAGLGLLPTAGLLEPLPSFLYCRSNPQLDSHSLSERSPQSSSFIPLYWCLCVLKAIPFNVTPLYSFVCLGHVGRPRRFKQWRKSLQCVRIKAALWMILEGKALTTACSLFHCHISCDTDR